MAHSTKKLGMMFIVGACSLGLLLLTLVFSEVLERQHNPNQSVATIEGGGFEEVVLQRNRMGHYVFNGEINRKPVTFMVDTGATTTAIPINMQHTLGLQPGHAISVNTANGVSRAYLTRLDQLKLGAIELQDVGASIIQGMSGNEVLLGMNVLKNFELVQRGNQLIIRRYR